MTPINRIEDIRKALRGASRVFIFLHNDPDPDAIASGLALRYLLTEKLKIGSDIVYKGFIGRAENRAMVEYLGNPLTPLNQISLNANAATALVDTQPGAGNNPLPEGLIPAIVIDHHGLTAGTQTALYSDVRPEMGSTSSIMAEYLIDAELEPPTDLATALFYGIKTDTMGLSRSAHLEDVSAYFNLQPKIDVNALAKIEQAQVPLTYFKSIDDAIHAGRIYDGDVLIVYLGKLVYPDKCAEIADLLMRLQGIVWVFCMGVFRRELILSVRTISKTVRAGRLVREVIRDRGTAGGHGVMAADHIELKAGESPEQVAAQLQADILLRLKGKQDVPFSPMM